MVYIRYAAIINMKVLDMSVLTPLDMHKQDRQTNKITSQKAIELTRVFGGGGGGMTSSISLHVSGFQRMA